MIYAMNAKNPIALLDAAYADSFEEKSFDRNACFDALAGIAQTCDAWLAPGARKTREQETLLRRIRKFANAECEALLDEGRDVLTHWILMRDLMLQTMKSIRQRVGVSMA